MNIYALPAVLGIRADSCPLFLVAHLQTLGTCPPHAAHPPAVSPELHSLTAVCCAVGEQVRLRIG